MRMLSTSLSALMMIVCAVPALARCQLYLPMRIGPTTGNPEKDTIGLFCAQPDASPPVVSAAGRRPLVQVGSSTGNVEKDTVGFALSSGREQAAR